MNTENKNKHNELKSMFNLLNEIELKISKFKLGNDFVCEHKDVFEPFENEIKQAKNKIREKNADQVFCNN